MEWFLKIQCEDEDQKFSLGPIKYKILLSWARWPKSVILATREVEIGRLMV
jgi:hypothetical protein